MHTDYITQKTQEAPRDNIQLSRKLTGQTDEKQ